MRQSKVLVNSIKELVNNILAIKKADLDREFWTGLAITWAILTLPILPLVIADILNLI